MDWSKAKNVLIVAFIVINILLGYALIIKDKNVDATVSSDFIEKATVLLNNKDIVIATEIPRTNPILSALTVIYEIMKPQTLNKNYFNNKGISITKGEGLIEISHEEEILTIVNKKLQIYENRSIEDKYEFINEEEAVDIAIKFLEDRKFKTDDMKLSFTKRANDSYYLEFSKIYNDIYLESAFTNIQIDNRGVVKMERMWLDLKEEVDSLISISTAPKSILGLLSMKEVYGKTITDISLCYYFNPGKHDYIEGPIEAKQGRAIPAWRIQFDDGYKVIIDNY